MTETESVYFQDVGRKLFSARKKIGFTQEALAKVFQISTNCLAQWERGEKKISKGNQEKISCFEEISQDERVTEVIQRYLEKKDDIIVAVVVAEMLLAVRMLSKDGYSSVEKLLKPCSKLVNAIKEISNAFENNNFKEIQ